MNKLATLPVQSKTNPKNGWPKTSIQSVDKTLFSHIALLTVGPKARHFAVCWLVSADQHHCQWPSSIFPDNPWKQNRHADSTARLSVPTDEISMHQALHFWCCRSSARLELRKMISYCLYASFPELNVVWAKDPFFWLCHQGCPICHRGCQTSSSEGNIQWFLLERPFIIPSLPFRSFLKHQSTPKQLHLYF